MENFEDQSWLDSLYHAVKHSRDAMEPFQVNFRKFVLEFIGKHHSDGGTDDKVPMPLLQQDVMSYLRLLASHNPQMLVSTRFPQLKPLAADMEAWGNWRIDEMNLESTIRRCVQNCLLGGTGICKVGLTFSQSYESEGHYYGEPFADPIELEDYFHDMTASSIEQLDFQGHIYKMPLSSARQEPLFDEVRRSELQSTTRIRHNEQGNERLKNIEDGQTVTPRDEYTDYVWLSEIWLTRERAIITCEWTERGPVGKPLRIVRWKGPYCGPFHLLVFIPCPGNTMGVSPIGSRYDLHTLINAQFRKAARQTEASKTVLAYQGNAERDAKKIKDASDGECIPVTHVDAIKEISFRGADQAEFQVMGMNVQYYDRFAGNLTAIAGLGHEAPTLGQEELIQSNSSAQVKDMQQGVLKFVKNIMRSLCWYWMNDDQQVYETERFIDGVEFPIPVQVYPQDRVGNFMKLNFDIQPYSLQGKTPQEKNQQIDTLLANILIPLAPILAQQGVFPNLQGILRQKAKYTGMTDLADCVTFAAPQAQDVPYDEPPKMPSATTRTNVRVNRSTKTDQGQAIVGMQNAQGMANEPRVAL